MTTFSNCCGSVKRPCVSTLSWKALPGLGGWPSVPAATWTFCARSAETISPAVRLSARSAAGIDPHAHGELAAAEQLHVAHALDPARAGP